jgi:NAD(P)-dependent dehydrogenase (short-subunit alcohol dehydrogenase family)
MSTEFAAQNLFSLEGKTALVTGGSSGLGYMMAMGLLQNGVKVYIASRKKEKCESAAKELSQWGECVPLVADVTDSAQRANLVQEMRRLAPGGISILVNNAGANWGARLEDYPDNAFDKVMNTNVTAVFSLTRDLIDLMQRTASPRDPARVINIGSMDGLHVPVVQRLPTFAYSASKAALHHLTRALAVDVGPRHITVNAIAPGFFSSKMADYVIDHYRQDIEDDCPLGRIGTPEDIVGVLMFLTSRAGAYVNGAVIPVDGGTHVSKGRRPWMADEN